ncbi:NAD-dependent succinate-semialdehyde dehydrogenase [Kozakia baliensis]|uniref:NAD-dependent succinate-semialdehyde dehydrogenase n=1 Tax=Kozakia baliensis TaxID=153496 RepID=UPI000496B18D|nr:NAD-dependent succinate-semialdehyde dehydrogenase [Kozakia baliensis]
MAYATINPFTNEQVAEFPNSTDAEVEQALTQAVETQVRWAEESFEKRAAIVRKAAQILREKKKEHAHFLTLEMGKLFKESVAEVELSADILEYYADHAERFLAPKPLEEANKVHSLKAMVVNEPLGVILAVEPWNFPYYQLARVAGPQLMAGNTVICKHASIVPQCAKAFHDLFVEAGAPKGAWTNLFPTRDQLNKLVDDERIAAVCLTGGEKSGAAVAARAGQNLKKTTLELGGSDAFIVLEDADIDKTVRWALWGRMNNGGQCCVASKRFIVVDSVADEFLKKFQQAMSGLKGGDPFKESTTLPPMSSQSAADGLKEQVENAVKNGAKAIPCGEAPPSQGAFVQPTILTDITRENPAYFEEFFGPVALFFRVKDENEAIKLANDSEFGLGGSVFTGSEERGARLAAKVKTGMMFVNHPTWTCAELPFGGIKKSGFGRELSALGIDEFVNKKLITVVDIDAPVI